jgi:hypothetical protein
LLEEQARYSVYAVARCTQRLCTCGNQTTAVVPMYSTGYQIGQARTGQADVLGCGDYACNARHCMSLLLLLASASSMARDRDRDDGRQASSAAQPTIHASQSPVKSPVRSPRQKPARLASRRGTPGPVAASCFVSSRPCAPKTSRRRRGLDVRAASFLDLGLHLPPWNLPPQ